MNLSDKSDGIDKKVQNEIEHRSNYTTLLRRVVSRMSKQGTK
jgi:hypothetical protein